MKRVDAKSDRQAGAAMVEFAIVLPVLALLLMGIIEFSIIIYDKAVITNASRVGARYAIVADPEGAEQGKEVQKSKRYRMHMRTSGLYSLNSNVTIFEMRIM